MNSDPHPGVFDARTAASEVTAIVILAAFVSLALGAIQQTVPARGSPVPTVSGR